MHPHDAAADIKQQKHTKDDKKQREDPAIPGDKRKNGQRQVGDPGKANKQKLLIDLNTDQVQVIISSNSTAHPDRGHLP